MEDSLPSHRYSALGPSLSASHYSLSREFSHLVLLSFLRNDFFFLNLVSPSHSKITPPPPRAVKGNVSFPFMSLQSPCLCSSSRTTNFGGGLPGVWDLISHVFCIP